MNDEAKDIQDMSDAERKNIAEQGVTEGNMLFNRQAFAQAYQVARLFSSSQLVPQHLQGKPNDCFIALHMANRLGEDPLMVCQNIIIVNGTAGWKATWLIGRANRSEVFHGRIRFTPQGSGDNLSVTASAVLADTGEEVKATVDMKMAKAEGWTKNPKYQSMPEQMLSYRAASFLIRLYCPEATLGYQTAEELQDMAASGEIKNVTPGRHTPVDNGGAEQALRNLGQDMSGPGEPPADDPEPNAGDTPTEPAKPAPKKKAASKKKAAAKQDDEPDEPTGASDAATAAIERMENAQSKDELDEIADEALNGTDLDEAARERLTAAHKRNAERLDMFAGN